MEQLNFNTPGLLFPAISLLMLAYTNRFLGLTSAARNLVQQYRNKPDARLLRQVESLRERLSLVRLTQAMGVTSLLFCTACLLALFLNSQLAARIGFAAAMLFMLASLGISLREIYLSVRAINIEFDSLLSDAGQRPDQPPR
ncbi:MAG: DUF2721 domain-containing protein [Cupriavidus sp.]|nr:MAG: DUF2721 domain-containing protein [Cupriavidus sp.]